MKPGLAFMHIQFPIPAQLYVQHAGFVKQRLVGLKPIARNRQLLVTQHDQVEHQRSAAQPTHAVSSLLALVSSVRGHDSRSLPSFKPSGATNLATAMVFSDWG